MTESVATTLSGPRPRPPINTELERVTVCRLGGRDDCADVIRDASARRKIQRLNRIPAHLSDLGGDMSRKRVLVAGLGDVGILIAIRLARHADVVGISVKPALVSGQELGVRLSRPDDWARDYWIPFDRFRRLDRVRTVQATLTGVDLTSRTVFGQRDDGTTIAEDYDALVISTGVSNGFWRRPVLQSAAEISADLHATHNRLGAAHPLVVFGGGAAPGTSGRHT